jgi:hypothetical protein
MLRKVLGSLTLATFGTLFLAVSSIGCGSGGGTPAGTGSGGSGPTGTGGAADTGGTPGMGGGPGAGGEATGGAGGTGVGGAGTGPAGTVPASGMFVWMVNGQTLIASNVDPSNAAAFLEVGYTEGATMKDAKSLLITIAGRLMNGESCSLVGQFQAVPPPAGTYPIVAKAIDGSFTATCANGMIVNNTAPMVLSSLSGQVVLTKSVVGDIEGTFAMQAAPFLSAPPVPATAFSGGFNMGCSGIVAMTSSSCTAHTAGAGTCADLLACCNKPNALKVLCMGYYTGLMTFGDASCGNLLAVSQTSLCP